MEIETIGTTTIYVNTSGRFHAEIDGKTVYRASLATLEKLIQANLDPLPVMVSTSAWTWNVREDAITRATKHKMKGKHSDYDRYSGVYVYDKDAMEKLKGLLTEQEAFRKKRGEILKSLTRVTPENLEELRAEYTAREEPK